jgi:hypothetical protein
MLKSLLCPFQVGFFDECWLEDAIDTLVLDMNN